MYNKQDRKIYMKLVSIIVPFFNAAKTIESTLISNLNDLIIKTIDSIINIVVIAKGKTAPNGLKVLAS